MVWGRVADIALIVHPRRMPTVEDWDVYVSETILLAKQSRAMPFARQLVVTDGGSPTYSQGTRVVELLAQEGLDGSRFPTCVVTHSWRVRLMLLFARPMINVRTFAPSQAHRALQWLGPSQEHLPALAAELEALCQDVGGCCSAGPVQEALREASGLPEEAWDLAVARTRMVSHLRRSVETDLGRISASFRDLGFRSSGVTGAELLDLGQQVEKAYHELPGVLWALESPERSWKEVSEVTTAAAKAILMEEQEFESSCAGDESRLVHGRIALHLLRIVQEASSNAARHSQASRVRLQLELHSDEIALDFADDGRGLAEVTEGAASGGIEHIRRRAEDLGGVATLTSTAAGTRWTVLLPLESVPRSERPAASA